MRRKIHCVLRVIERMNVQIDFDPIALFTRVHGSCSESLTFVVRISMSITSISKSKKNTLDTCQSLLSAESFSLSTLGWWNWQTRTFEGRMPKGLRVQVPPRAQFPTILSVRRLIVQNRWLVRNKSNQSEVARISSTYAT